jgi:hypothetical protein
MQCFATVRQHVQPHVRQRVHSCRPGDHLLGWHSDVVPRVRSQPMHRRPATATRPRPEHGRAQLCEQTLSTRTGRHVYGWMWSGIYGRDGQLYVPSWGVHRRSQLYGQSLLGRSCGGHWGRVECGLGRLLDSSLSSRPRPELHGWLRSWLYWCACQLHVPIWRVHWRSELYGQPMCRVGSSQRRHGHVQCFATVRQHV